MRIESVISIENVKFNRKVGEDPANIDTILLNLIKKRKLI
jgi:hypothetical protein